jgi:hypothetical protein
VGRHQEALSASEEAAILYQALAADNPGYCCDLAFLGAAWQFPDRSPDPESGSDVLADDLNLHEQHWCRVRVAFTRAERCSPPAAG